MARGAVFLDRDGVINRRRVGDWVRRPEELEPLPGALAAIARLTSHGASPVVVTNQSGIGRGVMTAAEVERVHAHLRDLVARAGGILRAIYVCPHAPDAGCTCRKPGLALFERAARELSLDLSTAAMVGDAPSDIAAARAGGFARALLVTDPVDGYPSDAPPPDRAFASLSDAVEYLLTLD